MLKLKGTPYLLDSSAEQEIIKQIQSLEERVNLLRSQGTLTAETIKNYYGEKRFEQIAESNAIEGSTLSVGETELAVLKGITITGHDPAFFRDAISLDKALERLTELAKKTDEATDINQLHQLHSLILGEQKGAGIFRREPVKISGSSHTPPKTWEQIMDYMENWEKWSIDNKELAIPIRATILHSWLAHIHPFIDGNGRAARAISNLELIRSGYPPIIIRKIDRGRYINALMESDIGGDIRDFVELILEKIEGSLIGLEISAKTKQGYNPAHEKIRKKQEQNLRIWETSVKLLIETLNYYLNDLLDPVKGTCDIKVFESSLDLDDYLALCERSSTARSWIFILNITIPGLPTKLERLAYFGFRSSPMYHHLGDQGGPAIYWSIKNPSGYPKWKTNDDQAPYTVEFTTKQGIGDSWYVRKFSGQIQKMNTTKLAHGIAKNLLKQISDNN